MNGVIERVVDKLLARYRRDAILLHRPYPPHIAERTNSKFGGLPRLPEQHEWPRTPDGLPLHFLAQIDCADIGLGSALPARGVLFFFGRHDEEQIWRADKPEEACRVLYVEDASAETPQRAAPADLPPIGGNYPPPFARPFLHPGEAGPNIHVEWPIQPLSFDSWPDSSVVSDVIPASSPGWGRFSPARLFERSRPERTSEMAEILKQYDEVLKRQRDAEYYRVTKAPPPAPGYEWEEQETAVALRLYGSDGAPDAFPQCWAHVDFFCRAATAYIAAGRTGFEDPTATTAAATCWIERAKRKSPTDPVADADRTEFRAWAASLHKPAPRPLNGRASSLVIDASLATVRAFAGDTARATLISPSAYDALAPFFHGHSVWGTQFSQMLGHATASQEARSVDDPTVCLLNLATDACLGRMFGDVGECTFWISSIDLARRDFSRAWGTIAGH